MNDPVRLKRSPIIRAIAGGSYLAILLAFVPALGFWPGARLWIGAFTAAAAFVILYESGLEIEISPEGLRRRRRFPFPDEAFIRWSEVETVTADQKTIVRLGLLGDPVSLGRDSRLVVRGGGRSIVLHVPLFLGAPEDTARVLELARAAAVRWTLAEVLGKGKARLGPVTVTGEGISFAGKLIRGPVAVRFRDMTLVSFQHGTLRFDAGGRSLRVPLSELPNGLYLAQVISALS